MYEIFEQLLQDYNVTPYRVAKETGIGQSTFTDWKNGKSTPKQDKLQKIANYFNVTINQLMGTEDVENEKEFEAKNHIEKEMLLLCRKVNDAPAEDREEIINQFKGSINLYLKAKGLTKGE